MKPGNHSLTWFVFAVFAVVVAVGLLRHELWSDELQPWNLVNDADSVSQLIAWSRYDGHPPLFYLLLYLISRFTGDPDWIKILPFLCWSVIAFLLLFRSPFRLDLIVLLLSGYYFLFEYFLFTRNYCLCVAAAFGLCSLVSRNKGGSAGYYLCLLILCFSHLYGLLLGGCFQLYFLFSSGRSKRLVDVLFPALVFSCAAYFLVPPGGMRIHGYAPQSRIDQLFVAGYLPLKAFIPLPDFRNFHFWNTYLFLSRGSHALPLWTIRLPISLALISAPFLILRDQRKSWIFLACVSLSILSLAAFLPISSARHVGILFVATICVLWITPATVLTKRSRMVVLILLLLQCPGGIASYIMDVKYPFAPGASAETAILKTARRNLVCDVWAMNYLSARTHEAYYVLEFREQARHIVLDTLSVNAWVEPHCFSKGLSEYYSSHSSYEHVYWCSVKSPRDIFRQDADVYRKFGIELVYASTPTIERFSRLYLYKVTKVTAGK